MSTLLKFNKEKEMPKVNMTPEEIRNKLFYFENAVHAFHQDTTGGWEHDALGKLYKMVEEIIKFAKNLEEWAEGKEYCDIENIAQSLSGDGAKAIYRLSLK